MHSGNSQQAAPNNTGAQAREQRPQVQHSFPPLSHPYNEDRRHDSHVGETAPLLTFGPLPPYMPAQQQSSQQMNGLQNYYTHPQQQPQMNQRSNASGKNVAYYDPRTKLYYTAVGTLWSSIERISIIGEVPETSQPAKQPSRSSVPKEKEGERLSKRPAGRDDDQPRKKPKIA
ncbi:predicted protein [Sclerotinia sclerotiorum 1980 UF-70]|uniref:Uncharacterized protein n=2 Tax=Sclerotinia sclerotiorum (strain ATCC 18683 / 1980 / Ss-1) TaxID=665079 RepID=A7F6H7_SCLS1|nr:predicted protein [Sclerotinia sclerotiorum 1980 UF-70]APA08289.1 hypothetical protein sscle_03g030590 [Sclerotinia sclerotiorum 1980 UF-70]EDN98348.1 predicted protein [Sclerotinia sclerotiorum 1980 UF-70]